MTYALVKMIPFAAQAVVASWASQETAKSGVSQDDAVQLATALAGMQSAAAFGWMVRAAKQTKNGFRAPQLMTIEDAAKAMADGDTVLPVLGGTDVLPQDHDRRMLVLALDGAIRLIRDAPQGGDTPYNTTPSMLPLLAVPPVAVIVAGAAAAIAAAAVIWRFLDPEARANIAAVAQAGQDYALRLAQAKVTGTLPPPSEMEKGAATAIETLAKGSSSSRWGWAAAGLGGFAAGGVSSIVSRQLLNR